jgi:hypothetical protein
VFLVSWLAFFIILSCYASVVLIAFLIIATVTMFVRPALFAFACLLAAVWRVLTTVLIAFVAPENAEVSLVAEPVLRALRIVNTIEAHPNTFVVITIVALVTVLIEYALFAFACLLAAVGRVFCTVLVISAALFADVYIAILVLRAQTILTHTTLSLYTFVIGTIVA